MHPSQWTALDSYFNETLGLSDPILDAALARAAAAGLPAHEVAPNQGRMLQIFAQMTRARRILEIGTLGGYSAICMARALPSDGRLISLERDPAHAQVARQNVELAGLSGIVRIMTGDAHASLDQLRRDALEPFDLIFIDADKQHNPAYLEAALALSRDGTVIVADNIARAGRLQDAGSQDDPDVRGVQAFLQQLGQDLRLNSTAIQTVGAKGWDGYSLSIVRR
ncbi:O-methyltransferase [Bordetella sp. 2513F-2]